MLLASIGLLLTSCKKNKDKQPSPTNDKFKFNISIENLPGQNTILDGLSAIVSIKSANGQLVVENRAIPLSYSGNYISDFIELPKGNYELVKLVLQRQANSLFASPYVGSSMEQYVTKPLAIAINLNKAELTTAVEVLAVENHKAEDFGYADGTFNLPPPIDNAEDFILDLKPIFKVGKIVYDSVPAVLQVTTYPVNGQPIKRYYGIAAGGQKITLSKSAAKYKLHVSKWGIDDEMELGQTDMKDQELYIGGSTDVAKKIKTESVYLLSDDKWIPQTRKEYTYNTLGLVMRITHLSKAANGATVVDGTEELSYYANNKVSEIHYNVNGNSKTTYFWYKADGKIDRMKETNSEGNITAALSYLGQRGQTGITSSYQVGATYEFSSRYYKQYVTAEMVGGNALSYNNHTSHGDSEETITSYDFGINPYAHLAIPDFWLTNLSRHNRTDKWTQYRINIPKHDAFKFSYTYDAEGFPKEIITKYRVSNTATEAYSTKTVFTY